MSSATYNIAATLFRYALWDREASTAAPRASTISCPASTAWMTADRSAPLCWRWPAMPNSADYREVADFVADYILE